MTDKEENLIEKEQIKIFKHYISELTKYIEETATILDINTSATILGKNCIEYWAVLSSASNNAIKKLQQENEELKQSQEDAEKVLKNILDNFDKMENHYRKALEEIEEITQNHIINDFSNWNIGEISDDIVADYVLANCKQILDIINKVKGDKNG